MEICHHIIQDNLIAGIGPLMERQYPDLNARMLYNSRQLWFFLHLKHHSVQIESDWFNIGSGATDAEKAERKNYVEWRHLYDAALTAVNRLCFEQQTQPHVENNY